MADTKISALTAVSGAARSMLIPVVEDPSGTPVTKKMTVSQLLSLDSGSHSSSSPLLDMAQTWNAGGTTFTAMKINVTNTASAAASMLIDLQVGGTSKFSVTRAGVVTSSASVVTFNLHASNALYLTSDSGLISIGASNDTILARDAANTLAQRNGTNAQSLRIYNTYTDASNYERGVIDWGTTANVLTIGTQKAGTGSARNIDVVAGGVRKLDYGITTADRWTVHSILTVAGDFGCTDAYITGEIVSSNATLMRAAVNLTNGAGASAGTLLNAPVAGDPTKWIPINDNGTTRYIPCW